MSINYIEPLLYTEIYFSCSCFRGWTASDAAPYQVKIIELRGGSSSIMTAVSVSPLKLKVSVQCTIHGLADWIAQRTTRDNCRKRIEETFDVIERYKLICKAEGFEIIARNKKKHYNEKSHLTWRVLEEAVINVDILFYSAALKILYNWKNFQSLKFCKFRFSAIPRIPDSDHSTKGSWFEDISFGCSKYQPVTAKRGNESNYARFQIFLAYRPSP